MAVHLVSVLGGDSASTIPHFIDHYSNLGASSFLLIGQAESLDDGSIDTIHDAVRTCGLELRAIHVGPWHEHVNAALIRKVMNEHQNDWFIVSDSDELQVYKQPLNQVLAWCDKSGYDYVEGYLLDRVAEGGELLPITNGSIAAQFPLAGSITYPILKALSNKIVLARGHVRISTGNHWALSGRGAPRDQCCTQVHHFKWTSSVVARLQKRISRTEEGEWRRHSSVLDESRRVLQHIASNDGRLNTTDPKFRFAYATLEFLSYPLWEEMRRTMEAARRAWHSD